MSRLGFGALIGALAIGMGCSAASIDEEVDTQNIENGTHSVLTAVGKVCAMNGGGPHSGFCGAMGAAACPSAPTPGLEQTGDCYATCSFVMIAPRWALTAADCVGEIGQQVFLGGLAFHGDGVTIDPGRTDDDPLTLPENPYILMNTKVVVRAKDYANEDLNLATGELTDFSGTAHLALLELERPLSCPAGALDCEFPLAAEYPDLIDEITYPEMSRIDPDDVDIEDMDVTIAGWGLNQQTCDAINYGHCDSAFISRDSREAALKSDRSAGPQIITATHVPRGFEEGFISSDEGDDPPRYMMIAGSDSYGRVCPRDIGGPTFDPYGRLVGINYQAHDKCETEDNDDLMVSLRPRTGRNAEGIWLDYRKSWITRNTCGEVMFSAGDWSFLLNQGTQWLNEHANVMVDFIREWIGDLAGFNDNVSDWAMAQFDLILADNQVVDSHGNVDIVLALNRLAGALDDYLPGEPLQGLMAKLLGAMPAHCRVENSARF